ncbi:MAG: hypothetical protein V7641_5292 [Blastocatellia bacterium]
MACEPDKIQQAMLDIHEELRKSKPNDGSERDRQLRIFLADFEKAYAYYCQFLAEG